MIFTMDKYTGGETLQDRLRKVNIKILKKENRLEEANDVRKACILPSSRCAKYLHVISTSPRPLEDRHNHLTRAHLIYSIVLHTRRELLMDIASCFFACSPTIHI